MSGIGKSGHVARKIASTLASTGTPAFFVHPAEASHGDLGMVTRDDVMIALSNSGESPELLMIVPLIKRLGGKLIAMTGDPDSTLAREADVHLDAKVAEEACSLGLAPTAAPPPRWPWVTRWRLRCWRRADSARRILRVRIPAAAWAAACSPTCVT